MANSKRSRLEAEIERAIARTDDLAPAFRWGRRDCLLFAANIVRRAIGIDPAEPWRGRYYSQSGAERVIGPRGLLWVSRQRAREIGAKRVKVADAKVGDWGCLKSPYRGSVIKYRNDYWLGCGPGFGGMTLVKNERVAAAWSFCDDEV